VLLATQNPVDLDYKGLSNTGTWFIGRLQTERDKARVLEGLEGASAGNAKFDRGRMTETLAGLGSRVFLMHNVHEDAPITFETRWTLSYLRGPLTRTHIKQLTQGREPGTGNPPSPEASARQGRVPGSTSENQVGPVVPTRPDDQTAPASPASAEATAGRPARPSAGLGQPALSSPPQVGPVVPTRPDVGPTTSGDFGRLGEPSLPSTPPVLPPGVTALFVPVRGAAAGSGLAYAPALYVAGTVRLADQKRGVAETREIQRLVPLQDGAAPLVFEAAQDTDVSPGDLEPTPRGPASYADLPGAATSARSYDKWRKDVATWLYDTESLTLWSDRASGLSSTPGESEAAFAARVADARRQARDAKVDALRKKYAPKVLAQQERIRKAEQQLGKQQQEVTSSTGSAVLTVATGVFGALFGRKTFSAANAGRLGTAARGAGKVMKEKQDVTRAQETVAAEQQKLAELQTTVEAEAAALAAEADTVAAIETIAVRPKKSDITVSSATLVWVARA
jgi:hypothetical protein